MYPLSQITAYQHDYSCLFLFYDCISSRCMDVPWFYLFTPTLLGIMVAASAPMIMNTLGLRSWSCPDTSLKFLFLSLSLSWETGSVPQLCQYHASQTHMCTMLAKQISTLFCCFRPVVLTYTVTYVIITYYRYYYRDWSFWQQLEGSNRERLGDVCGLVSIEHYLLSVKVGFGKR